MSEARLDDHDRRIDAIEKELQKMLGRLAAVEADRELMRGLAETTRTLGDRIREFADGVEQIAERAVEKVLERKHEKRRAEWKYRLGLLAGGVGVLSVIAQHAHHL